MRLTQPPSAGRIAPGTRLQIPIPHTGSGGHLSIDFTVIDGNDVDFDLMFEDTEATAVRLYG